MLDDDMNLVTTQYEPIYRGDHLSRKITYLIPKKVGDIDTAGAAVYLNIVRADGAPDVVLLRRMEEPYSEKYLRYQMPVTCKLSKYPGEAVTWLQIMAGPACHPHTAKSGENIIRVTESKDMDEYIGDWRSDRVLTALYQTKKHMEDALEQYAEEDKDYVYVPHVDDRKVLTFTIEEQPGEVPPPTDLNPHDEWSGIGPGGTSDYIWEPMTPGV